MPTAFGSSVGQGPSDTEHGRAYRLRKHLEHLEGVGSALHLPAAVIRDAGQILTEVCVPWGWMTFEWLLHAGPLIHI